MTRSAGLLATAALLASPLPAQPLRDLGVAPSDVLTARALAAPHHIGDQRVSLGRRPMCFECGQRTVMHIRPSTGARTPFMAYTGLHTVLLVPLGEHFTGATPFTQAQLRTFLDRLDLAYEHFLALFGLTPVRAPCRYRPADCAVIDDYLRVSLFDCTNTEGEIFLGCAGLNDVFITVKDDVSTALAAGLDHEAISKTTYHEMAHSFDSLDSYTHYLPDHFHAWTPFLKRYLPYYHRSDSILVLASVNPFQARPDPLFVGPLRNITRIFLSLDAYFASPLTWDACVANQPTDFFCGRVWAGLTTFYTVVHGPGAFRGAMDYLHDYAAAHPPPPSAAAKSDLFVRALAAGAHANISCMLDGWKWRLPQWLRSDLEAQYGATECIDVQATIDDILANGPANLYSGGSQEPEALLWGYTDKAIVENRTVTFTAVTQDLGALVDIRGDPLEPTHVRFWVSGVGFVGAVPWAPEVTYTWLVPLDVPAGSYGYRAQLMNSTTPLSGETPLRTFEIAAPPGCYPDATTACLLDNRFQVRGTMTDFATPAETYRTTIMDFPGGRAESDQAVFLESFTPGNFEIGVKMLNGCGLPAGHPLRAFWAFFGGLTNAYTTIAVEDTVTGQRYEWSNPANEFPVTVGDTSAFPCTHGTPAQPCARDATTACLLDGRFTVTGTMHDFATPPQEYRVHVMSFPGGRAASDQAVFFESFAPGNFEIGVKMVDGCTLPAGHPLRSFWVFYGGLTNAETRIEVTQVATGLVDVWQNARGSFPHSEGRTSAFPCN